MLWFTSQKRQGLDKNKDNSSLTTTQATGCVSLVNPKSVRELGPRGYSNVWIFRLSRHFSLFYPESFTPKLANMSICHATIIRAATFFYSHVRQQRKCPSAGSRVYYDNTHTTQLHSRHTHDTIARPHNTHDTIARTHNTHTTQLHALTTHTTQLHSRHTHDTIARPHNTHDTIARTHNTHTTQLHALTTIARTHDTARHNCTHSRHTTQLHALTTHTRHNYTPSRHTITRTHDKIARHDTVGDCFPTSLSIQKTLHVKFEGAALRKKTK